MSKAIEWSIYHVTLDDGFLSVKDKNSDQILAAINLSEEEVYISAIGNISKNGFKEIVIVGATIIHIKVMEEPIAQHWLKVLRREAIKCLSKKDNANESLTLNQVFDQFHDLYEDDEEENSNRMTLLSPRVDEIHEKIAMVAPPLNIVILVV